MDQHEGQGPASLSECGHCRHWDDFGPCCSCQAIKPDYLREAAERGRALARMDMQRDEQYQRARFWREIGGSE
jgi:hypothetical protein